MQEGHCSGLEVEEELALFVVNYHEGTNTDPGNVL